MVPTSNVSVFSAPTLELAPRHLLTSTKVTSPLDAAPMTIVGAEVAIDEYDKWKDLFASIFTWGDQMVRGRLCDHTPVPPSI